MSAEAKRSKPYVRRATLEDCAELAPKLRPEDQLECIASGGPGALISMSWAVAGNPESSYAVVRDDDLIALFGVVPGASGGSPWMLASPALSTIRKSFLVECRGYVNRMIDSHGDLSGQVWARNATHIQWLRWLGFEIHPETPRGPLDEPFHLFTMRSARDV